ncbi:hypothetical protein C7458_102754 [Williamsia muralis]|nr:hypothetical protein C7458_102754 [Williamsia marianensis]
MASASQITGFMAGVLAGRQGIDIGNGVPPMSTWGSHDRHENARQRPAANGFARDAEALSDYRTAT